MADSYAYLAGKELWVLDAHGKLVFDDFLFEHETEEADRALALQHLARIGDWEPFHPEGVLRCKVR